MMNAIEAISGKRTWSAEDAQRALEAWEASGLSVSEFARRHEVDAQRLYAWRRKLRAKSTGVAFVPVRVVGAAPISEPIELELRGVRIRVGRGFDEDALRRVLVLLEGA